MCAATKYLLPVRVIILTLLLFVLYSINFINLHINDFILAAPLSLLLMSCLQAIVLAYIILRSRWSGWPLAITLFFAIYGITGFQPAIEAYVFLQTFKDIIPSQDIPSLFLNSAITAAVFAIIAVPLLGKWRPDGGPREPNLRLIMPWYSWLWKLLLTAFLYVVVYILFGAFVFRPLAGDAFYEFYGGIQLPDWFIPFQLLRGLIWAAVALPVIRMMRGPRWETSLAVALLFSFLMGFLLVIPNEYLPDAIRHAHLIEVTSENFLFGWLVALMLNPRSAVRRAD